MPDSFNSNACPYDLALSMSSCAGSSEEAPANMETVIDNDIVGSSLELHDCEPFAFLKVFFQMSPAWLCWQYEFPLHPSFYCF